MLKKILAISLLALGFNSAASATAFFDEQENALKVALTKQFNEDANLKAYVERAPQLALQEGRELHIVLGAGPFESHMKRLIDLDREREARENGVGQYPFKAPVRIFFTNDERVDFRSANERSPIFYANFNNIDDWNQLREMLIPEKTNRAIFNGPVSKIYFDWSVLKFAEWDAFGMIRIVKLLNPDGAIYLPGVNLASGSVFALSEVTRGEAQALIDVGTDESRFILNSRPYKVDIGPQKSPLTFLKGINCSPVEKRDGIEYTYNPCSLIYDSNFTEDKISERARKLVGPLTFQSFATGEGYPDIGSNLRDGMHGMPAEFFVVKDYVRVSKG